MFIASRRSLVVARGTLVLGLYWLLAVGAAKTALAAGTILSTGFESPYTVGPLEGQASWVTAGSGTSTASVQNSNFHSGSQAVQVSRTANSDRRWAAPVSGYPTQSFIVIDWDMRVAQTPNSTWFGPFFGIEAYDDAGPFGLLGSLGVDASTGDVLYQLQDNGALTETGRKVTFGQWHHYRLLLDFGSDTYRSYVNGALVATTGFVDRSLDLDDFTDADITAIAAAADPASKALASTAVFDNLLIRDGFGDYDVDGDVDAADYDVWRAAFGASVSIAGNGADGNDNGVVDAADYVVWRTSLATSASLGSGRGNFVVPEPASALAALMAVPGVMWLISRRTQRLLVG